MSKNDDFMDSYEENDELTPFIKNIVGDDDDVFVDYNDYGDGRHKVIIGQATLRVDAWMKREDLTQILKNLVKK